MLNLLTERILPQTDPDASMRESVGMTWGTGMDKQDKSFSLVNEALCGAETPCHEARARVRLQWITKTFRLPKVDRNRASCLAAAMFALVNKTLRPSTYYQISSSSQTRVLSPEIYSAKGRD